eukprot:Sdes_comp21113_c0_seq1m19792
MQDTPFDKRTEFLNKITHKVYTISTTLSRAYAFKLKQIYTEHGQDVPSELHQNICSKCCLVLTPGISCSHLWEKDSKNPKIIKIERKCHHCGRKNIISQ